VLQDEILVIERSLPLKGTVDVWGAKNSVLVCMAATILAKGRHYLRSVPHSADVSNMLLLLQRDGAYFQFDENVHTLFIDTTDITHTSIPLDIMQRMRASILVAGALIGRFGHAQVAMPGGCVIGARPINLHLKSFEAMGISLYNEGEYVMMRTTSRYYRQKKIRIVLEYPSVGATENSIMAAVLRPGETTIINASYEPEVADLVVFLTKMGAQIEYHAHACIVVHGVSSLRAVEHTIVPDRLEAGAFLLAAAVTGGEVTVRNGRGDHLEVFIHKLREMGHTVRWDNGGITLRAAQSPRAVSFKTGPYPGFPTDLQAPMMAVLAVAEGSGVIEETVFENRFMHARQLEFMGAQISVHGNKATIVGVGELCGTGVVASDIRASCALVLAGLVAHGETRMSGVLHWRRGYDRLEERLVSLGACIQSVRSELVTHMQQRAEEAVEV